MPKLKLAIAVMAYGGNVSMHQLRLWLEIGDRLRDHDAREGNRSWLVSFEAWDVNPVDRARNLALATAMQADADWLLMIDADVCVPKNAGFKVLRMIEDADSIGAGIVAAPVLKRDADGIAHIMIYMLDAAGTLQPAAYPSTRGLMPIDSAATALMAIDLHRVGDASFYFVQPGADQRGMSEDHVFCKQMREKDVVIMADTRVVTGHLARPKILFTDP